MPDPAATPAVATPPSDGTPPSQSDYAALLTRLEKLEASEHASKSQLGRAQAALKLASGDKADEFLAAAAIAEKHKAALVAAGRSDEEVETLREHNPKLFFQLGEEASAKAPVSGEIAELRTKIATLEAAAVTKPKSADGMGMGSGGGSAIPSVMTLADAQKSKRVLSPDEYFKVIGKPAGATR